jgi:hypothetical protein
MRRWLFVGQVLACIGLRCLFGVFVLLFQWIGSLFQAAIARVRAIEHPEVFAEVAGGIVAVLLLGFGVRGLLSHRTDWQRVISFDDDLDEKYFQMMRAPRFNRQFGVSKEWLREQSQREKLSNEFYAHVKSRADEVYGERLREDCRKRQDVSACDTLRQHGAM